MAHPAHHGGLDLAGSARIGCVLVPRFPLACELADRSELWNQPVAVGRPDAQAVWAASPVAMAHGVGVGLRLSEAVGRCPSLVVLDARPAHYERVWAGVLDTLEETAPGVEPVELGVAYVELAGLVRCYGTPTRLHQALLDGAPAGLRPRLGIGPTKFVARLAASRAGPGSVQVVPEGALATTLAAVPVSELPVDAEVIRRLQLVGVGTIGELMALPRRALVAQFGREGIRLGELLDGAAEPVRPRRHDEVLRERLALLESLASRDAVMTAGAQVLRRVLRHPRRRGRAARQVVVRVETEHQQRWEHTVTLRQPRSDHDGIWAALAPVLERARLPGPVSVLSIELRGLCLPSGTQGELFAERSTDDEARQARIEASLRQLQARYGRCPVGRIVPVEPWSRLPERRWALIELD